MISDKHVQARALALIKRVGATMVYRRITRTGDTAPVENPPSTASMSVVGLTALGANSITLDAPDAVGFLRPGDTFEVAGDLTEYTITNTVAGVGGVFTGVAFTPPLVAAAADNAAVAFSWAADTTLKARVQGISLKLVNGTTIRAGDLMVMIPKLSLTQEPVELDFIIFGGRPYTVESVRPAYVVEEPAFWTVQLRGR